MIFRTLPRALMLRAPYLVYFRGYSAVVATEKVWELQPGAGKEISDQLKTVDDFVDLRKLHENLPNG